MTISGASVNETEGRPSFEPLEPRLMLNAAPTDINLSHNRVNEQAPNGTLVAMLSGTSTPPPAQTIFSAGFETSEGYSDASGGDVDLAPQWYGGTSNQQGWFSQWYMYPPSAAANRFYVTDDQANGGSQSVKFVQPTYYYEYLMHRIPEKTSGVLTVQWSQYFDSVDTSSGRDTNNMNVKVYDRWDTDDTAYPATHNNGMGDGGYFHGQTEATFVDSATPDTYRLYYGTAASPNNRKDITYTGCAAQAAWVDYKAVCDLDNGTYDLYIDTGTGFGLADSDNLREDNPGNGFAMDVFSMTEFGAYTPNDENNLEYFYNPTVFAYIDDVLVTWAPPAASYNVTVQASDGQSAYSETFTIAVNKVEVLYRWDFETQDPVQFGPASKDFVTNFKGLTDERAFSGNKSFKLDVTFDGGVFYYFNVALGETINLQERHLALRGHVYVEESYNLSGVGIGHYTPGWHCNAHVHFPLQEGWQDFHFHLDKLLLQNDEPEYLRMTGWYLSFVGATGHNVVYLDEIELVEEAPPPDLADVLAEDMANRQEMLDGLQQQAADVQQAYDSLGTLSPAAAVAQNYYATASQQITERLAAITTELEQAGARPTTTFLADTRDELAVLDQAVAGLEALEAVPVGQRALVVEVPPISDILPSLTAMPIPGEATNQIGATACAGQYQPLALAVWSDQALQQVLWTIGDLQGPSGTIPAAEISVRAVKSWYRVVQHSEYASPRYVPELLLNDPDLITVNHQTQRNDVPSIDALYDPDQLQAMDIAAGESQLFWIVVHVPAGTLPDTYTGTLRLEAQNIDPIDVTLTAAVPALSLEPNPYYHGVFYRGSIIVTEPSASSETKTPAQYEADMRSLQTHGIIYPTFYTTAIDRLQAQMQMRNDAGLPGDLALLTGGCGSGLNVPLYQAAVAEVGYRNVSVWGIDEASEEQVQQELEAIARTHADGGLVHRTYWHPDAVGDQKIDLVIAGWGTDAAKLEAMHASGSRVVAYSNPYSWSVYPYTYRLHYGLGLWSKGFDGGFNYCFQHADDLWHTMARPLAMCYPSADGVVETVQWEGVRAGVDDLRYLGALQRTIDLAQDSGDSGQQALAAEAQQWMDETLGALVDEAVRPTLQVEYNGRALYLRPTYLDLDALRDEMVEWIEQFPASSYIYGTAWDDTDDDGIWDPREQPLKGVTIYLDQNDNGQKDTGEPTTVTLADDPNTPDNETGTYVFKGLSAGTYKAAQVAPNGWRASGPAGGYMITLADGQIAQEIDFGDHDILPPSVTAATVNDGRQYRSQVDSLGFTFSEDVSASLGLSDLTLHNETMGQAADIAGAVFDYDPGAEAATWDLSAVTLADGYYTATLAAAGVSDASGKPLDGDGDGTGGDDYNFTFFVLKCDANGDGRVDSDDLAAWQQNYDPLGLNDNDPGTGDSNGDGKVDSSDLALWQQRYNPLGLQEPAAGSDTGAAMAMKAVAESLAGGETLNPTVEWTFTDPTVDDEGTALWVSPTAIDPNFPLYDYTYEITKAEVYLDVPLVGGWYEITGQIPEEDRTGSETLDRSWPIYITEEHFEYEGVASADIKVHADADGSVDSADLALRQQRYSPPGLQEPASLQIPLDGPLVDLLAGPQAIILLMA